MAIHPTTGTTDDGYPYIETDINYYLDPSLGGITAYVPGTAGILRRKFDTHQMRIHDLRGHEDQFKIHTHAFEPLKWTPETKELTDEQIKKNMYPEAEALVKRITGATHVQTFSHLMRKNTVEDNQKSLNALETEVGKNIIKDDHGFGKVVPARFAHIDQSGKGARQLLHDNFPDLEAKYADKYHWGTINIWRPIKTIRKDPFCVCDTRTLQDEDLAIVESTLPKKGENKGYYDAVSKGDGFQTLEIRANPEHKWYYVSDMQPDEALMFKIFDSRSGRCGHTSFQDPRTNEDATRESMELRFFVFYENEPNA